MTPIRFALNRMSAPRMGLPAYCAMTRRLGVSAIEIRNDLSGVEITDDLLRAGIDAMDMVPQEFVDLAELCRSLGRQRHPRPERAR